MHYLQVSYFNHAENWVAVAGGAGFDESEARRRFDELPRYAGPDDAESSVVVDLLNDDMDIVNTAEITLELAGKLLGVAGSEVAALARADFERSQRMVAQLVAGGESVTEQGGVL